jgi:hypothetical protein
VALWYKHGVPVSGYIYNNNGRISASFVANGVEHTSNIGSVQVLTFNPVSSGFKLSWQTYKVKACLCRRMCVCVQVATTKGSGWWGVRVKDTAPCVINCGGDEYLGKVQLSEERAAYGDGSGKEISITGPEVQSFLVLCRDSPVPGGSYESDSY